MTPEILLQKALDAWGVEVATERPDYPTVKELIYKGNALNVKWSHEVVQDLAAFHGDSSAQNLVIIILNDVAKQVMEISKAKQNEVP